MTNKLAVGVQLEEKQVCVTVCLWSECAPGTPRDVEKKLLGTQRKYVKLSILGVNFGSEDFLPVYYESVLIYRGYIYNVHSGLMV